MGACCSAQVPFHLWQRDAVAHTRLTAYRLRRGRQPFPFCSAAVCREGCFWQGEPAVTQDDVDLTEAPLSQVRVVQHKQSRDLYALKYINKTKCVKMKAVANVVQERRLLEEVIYSPGAHCYLLMGYAD